MIEPHRSGNKLVGFYKGEVLKHEKNGKCKIWIPGVYDEEFKSKPEMLPDAAQAAPLVTADGMDTAAYFYPDVHSFVWCFFENSDANFPVYFANINLDKTAERYNNDEADIKFKFKDFEIEIDRTNSKAKIEYNGATGKEIISMNGATGTIDIEAPTKINIKSSSVSIKADVNMDISGGMTTTVRSSGILTLAANSIIISAYTVVKIMTNIGGITPGVGKAAEVLNMASKIPGLGSIASSISEDLLHVKIFD